MAVVKNNSGKNIVFAISGEYYQLPPDSIDEIPDIVLRMYLGYGLELNEDVIKVCCNRFRLVNPEFGQMSDKEVWDTILSKIEVGVKAIKREKNKMT